METRLSECEPMNIKKVRAKWEEGEYTNNFSPESMDAENVNIYNKAYDYIKTKDEYFADAIDC
ncbi:hypothetical protein [Romboutsia sp.]|uniref:hypothetical protein n=1 Tax=Romboutsia sp. TaxID=1965302 RepID=UPI002C11765C|nr:hypothetical protein [Romboutsia sp.]HSQ87506.1 hypothetical protein [Romboutsia sp.]